MGYIDSAALCRHASCFGIYLVVTVIYYGSYNVYTINPEQGVFVYFTWLSFVFWVFFLISNILLCYIFWDLI